MCRRASVALLTVLIGSICSVAQAQTAIYRLHKEVSATSSALDQLKAAIPDATAVAIASADMKNTAATEFLVKRFDTQTGVPNAGGFIPASSTLSFSIFVSKSASWGVMYPRFKVFLNDESSTPLCTATGTVQLTSTVTKYVLTCATPASGPIAMTTSDRFFLWVGVSIGTAPGNHSMTASVSVEGATLGNYDSQLTLPLPVPPSITSLTPNRGPKNTAVHVVGANFGGTQGASIVKFFSNLTASATNWGATAFDTSAPVAAATGPVTVTVGGASSGAVTFTVTPAPSVTSLNPSAAVVGQSVTISGSNFLALQASGSSTVTFNGTPATPTAWSDTSITVPVPAGATNGPVVVTVSGNQSISNPTFSVVTTGTLSGTITRVTGGTAVSGATVQAVLAGVTKGTATSAANGSYAIPNLDPGTYDVRVSATGFSSEVRSGTIVSVNAATTVGVSMLQPGSLGGRVTQADGITPISGAAVTLYSGPTQKGSASTNGTGDYSITGVRPGAFTVQAANVGYRTKQQGATVTENATATANLSLDPAATGPVSYVYDELSRLMSVIDPAGDAANYTYDAVGNLLAIARAGVGTVSISEVAPHAGPVGSPITIYGTGFSATPSSNTVTFNGTLATVTTSGPTALATTVPTGATSGSITVTTPTGSATSGAAFVVTAPTAGAPTIASFSPQIWDGASALTINGTNFDTTPANDRVNLNVALSTPTTASATNLSVAVPSTATSGRLTVATIAGTALSASDFFVPPPGYVAANLQSTGRITIGTSQTVSIPTAGKFAMLLFDGIPGHRVSANFTNVTLGTGTGAIYDPYGLGRSTGLDVFSARFIDVIAMPISATYTLLVASTGASTGNATVALYDVVDVSGTIVAGGAAQTVTIGTPGQNASLTFSGTLGQRISLDMPTVTIGGFGTCTTVTIKNPNGSPLVSNSCVTTQGAFIDVQTLPATGTYTIAIDPPGSATGSMTLTLYTVPVDVSGTIVAGGAAQTVTIGTPGQNASVTFSGTLGQRISLDMTNETIGWLGTCTTVTIKKPDGTTLVPNTCVTTQGAFIDVQTLPATGTYTIVIDPPGNATGSMTLTLYTVPVEVSGTIVAGGAAQTVTIGTPGQNASLTFSGTLGQRISLDMTNETIGWLGTCTTVTIKKPDGTTLLPNTCVTTQGAFIDVQTLPATGTYTIAIDPPGSAVGGMTLTLYDVVDVTGSLTINGAGLPVSISVPGQNANITVNGTIGQSLRIPVTTPGATTCATVTLLRQDNVTSVASIYSCGSVITLPSTTLPATETYHVVLDPNGTVTGSYSISVVSP